MYQLYTCTLIWVLDNSKEVTKEKDDLEWKIIENTRSLSRLGPTESYKPKKRSLEEELKVTFNVFQFFLLTEWASL